MFQHENSVIVNFSLTEAYHLSSPADRASSDLYWGRWGLQYISWEWLSEEAEINRKSCLEQEWEQTQGTKAEILFF